MTMKPLVSHRDPSGLSNASPFFSLQREIDRLFDDFGRNLGGFGAPDITPRMDLVESDTAFELSAELPGLEEKDVEISVSEGVLTLKGEKKWEKEDSGKTYRRIERSYGSFSRAVELPAGVDADTISARIDKGVLIITMPKSVPSRARKIGIQAAA